MHDDTYISLFLLPCNMKYSRNKFADASCPFGNIKHVFWANFHIGLIALKPMVRDMMIHEALKVIQHKLLDNVGKCCA
jgi:hypothetical protein